MLTNNRQAADKAVAGVGNPDGKRVAASANKGGNMKKCECGSESFNYSGSMPCTGYLICLKCGKEYRDYDFVKGTKEEV